MAEARGWMGYEMTSIAGVLWIIGRYIYASNYVKDPASRGEKVFLIGFPATSTVAFGHLGSFCDVYNWLKPCRLRRSIPGIFRHHLLW